MRVSLGYAELMQEGFYEPLGQKSLDALNTVLDIAKIESGQFTLNMPEYAIESVVETVRAATESLAENKTSSTHIAAPSGEYPSRLVLLRNARPGACVRELDGAAD